MSAQFVCACGCGGQLNPRLSVARDLRTGGMTFAAIGERLGITGAYVKAMLAKPPRFLKGHNGYVQHGIATCPSCGNTFVKRGPNQTVCGYNRACADARRAANQQKWHDYYAEIEERRLRRNGLTRERRELRRLLAGTQSFGSEAFRQRKLAEVDHGIAVLTDEIRDLWLDQQRDAQRWSAGKPWERSFDAAMYDDGTALHDVIQGDDAIARAFQASNGAGYVGDSWTDVVHTLIDRKREIDSYAESAA